MIGPGHRNMLYILYLRLTILSKVLFFSPILILWFVETIALALLLPLAFTFRFVEHRVIPLYILLVLIMHVGGTADLVADIALLGTLMRIFSIFF